MKYDVIFFSPHLDDAVLSCGGLITKFVKEKKRILVVTIFNKVDKSHIVSDVMSNYVEKCGYSDPLELSKIRGFEDEKVMNRLGVAKKWMNFVEADYRSIYKNQEQMVSEENLNKEKVLVGKVQIGIERLIENNLIENGELYFPLGLGKHIDHLILRKVGEKFKNIKVYFWEDYPYKMYTSNQSQLLRLRDKYCLNRVEEVQEFLEIKESLIRMYESQIKVIFGNKPMFLSSFEKYYVHKKESLNRGLVYLSDELEGGAKVANDYILREMVKKTDLNKFEFLEQVYRRDDGKLSGTKRWFWSVWSYKILLTELNNLNLTVLTTSPNALMAAWWLKKRGLIKNIKLELYSNGDRSYFSKSLLASKKSLSFIYYGIYCFGYRLMEKISVGVVDKIIVASEFYKKLVIEKYNLKKSNRVMVVAHGVDKKMFFDDKKKTVKSKIVGYVGRMDPQKGVLELIDAVNLLKSEGIQLWLVISSFNRDRYSELTMKKIKQNNRIKIIKLKSRTELAEIYRKIGLVVLVSEIESGPLVMYEALASGCGFIGSRTGNMFNILNKIDNRLLLDNLSPEEIAKKIKWYFEMSMVGVNKIREKGISLMKKYSWDAVADEILIIMRKL